MEKAKRLLELSIRIRLLEQVIDRATEESSDKIMILLAQSFDADAGGKIANQIAVLTKWKKELQEQFDAAVQEAYDEFIDPPVEQFLNDFEKEKPI